MRNQIGRFLGLLIVSGVALAVAIAVTAGGRGGTAPNRDDKTENNNIVPQTPVSVMESQLETIEITDSYSGMIRPWERFSLGFEIAGRVSELGTYCKGEPLDEGDRVAADQVLARLEDEVLRSRLAEAGAQLEDANARVEEAKAKLRKASSDLKRSYDLKQRDRGLISDAEYQADLANSEVAKAQVRLAEAQVAGAKALIRTAGENVEDTELRSPVDGVISRRMVNAGESVNPHQVIMEIIQVDPVLLVVGVPEAYVSEIAKDQSVHVELLTRNRLQHNRPPIEGRVYQVAEAADQTTGLFEVEIEVPNPDGFWKPGLIALGHIVVDQVQGYRVPMACAVFRDKETFLYVVDENDKAHRFNLFERGKDGKLHQQWIEQGSDLIIPKDWVEQGSDPIVSRLAAGGLKVVKRGQHRLVDGRPVKLVELPGDKPVGGLGASD